MKMKISHETLTALIHSTKTLIDLSDYLLQSVHFDYILTGKINSDPLEKRFGWYRQLAGANYLLSVRQFLEGEKKIRVKMLTQIENLDISEIQEIFNTSNIDRELIKDSVKWLTENCEFRDSILCLVVFSLLLTFFLLSLVMHITSMKKYFSNMKFI